MRYFISILLFLGLVTSVASQIVTIDPIFPKREEVITITYDATQGNAGLVGESQVYMHAGLITSMSNSGSDWKYVIGNWGTDDARVKMTNIGNDLHQISYVINDFHNVPSNIEIEQLAFVFRNADGSKVGKTIQQQDIFLEFNTTEDFSSLLISPTQANLIANLNDDIIIKFAASEVSDIVIQDNGSVIFEETTNYIEYPYTVSQQADHQINITATYDGITLESGFNITVNPEIIIEALPPGTIPGITHLSPTSARFVLMAPQKSNAYLIGDFNDWTISTDYFMKRTPNGDYFWIDVENLEADQNYAFQYLVDGTLSIADPFSELILDKFSDAYIDDETFPNLHPYPEDKAFGTLSLLRTGAEDFEWKNDFIPPAKEDLVIYELLMRDFTEESNYQTLLDTLDYLDRLGINAIEFMPVNEFEGNRSWGYNPSFHMALDKYYGSPTAFKTLVDECHRRGIAVILDVVYNHAFSQSPFAQMYWDAANSRPSSDSPFLNPIAKHPFNVGYDFNHESEYTKLFVKRVTKYWLEEYNVDGFRFDLSKGFTQKTSDNDGVFAAYDISRINILQDYADHIWDYNPEAYVILEHFAANNEEKVLESYGMMLWNNQNHAFGEGVLGYTANEGSNFEDLDYKRKGWNNPHAVGYMESHDEERLMYKNLNFGNSTSTYDVQELNTALKRMELASAFFYLIPGPKMLWQFGELGYDFSINRCTDGTISNDCRLSAKPIRWDYLEDLQRKQLYDVTVALIKLKTDYDLTKTTTYAHSLAEGKKFIRLSSDDMNAIVVGNFEIGSRSIAPGFQHKGWWYDYITGDSINVENQLMNIILKAGEYKVYLDQKIGDPTIISGINDPELVINDYNLYPNPTSSNLNISLNLATSQNLKISIYNTNGQLMTVKEVNLSAGKSIIDLEVLELDNGLYFVNLTGDNLSLTDRFLKQ